MSITESCGCQDLLVIKGYFIFAELEDLIRKILVKNPSQRYTIEQIKEHPWMQQGPSSHTEVLRGQTIDLGLDKGIDGDLNAQVISLMQGLKIDIEKTRKVRLYFLNTTFD